MTSWWRGLSKMSTSSFETQVLAVLLIEIWACLKNLYNKVSLKIVAKLSQNDIKLILHLFQFCLRCLEPFPVLLQASLNSSLNPFNFIMGVSSSSWTPFSFVRGFSNWSKFCFEVPNSSQSLLYTELQALQFLSNPSHFCWGCLKPVLNISQFCCRCNQIVLLLSRASPTYIKSIQAVFWHLPVSFRLTEKIRGYNTESPGLNTT